MNAFYTTIQIVLGILAPLIACGLVYLLIGLVSYLKVVFEHYSSEIRKRPPYDDIESSISFSDKSLVIQLVRKGRVVFEDKIPRSELEGSKEQ